MIKFNLQCGNQHNFEAWFSGGSDFDKQKESSLIECPFCGNKQIEKSLMVPQVQTGRQRDKNQETKNAIVVNNAQQKLYAEMREIVQKVKSNSIDVGDKFAEEARKIHYGEKEETGIYGKASVDDIKDLNEEGIQTISLPDLPDLN